MAANPYPWPELGPAARADPVVRSRARQWASAMEPARAAEYTRLLKAKEAAFPTYESVMLDQVRGGAVMNFYS